VEIVEYNSRRKPEEGTDREMQQNASLLKYCTNALMY
jgi:hypothetical protein